MFEACDLQPERPCQTDGFLLEGAQGWSPTMYIRLVQDFGLECEVAQHLSKSYGDRAFAVAKMAALTGKRWPIIGKKIHPEFPYIDAEVRSFSPFKSPLTAKQVCNFIYFCFYTHIGVINYFIFYNLFRRYVTVYGNMLELPLT